MRAFFRGLTIVLCLLLPGIARAPEASKEELRPVSPQQRLRALLPEVLTYEISWSKILDAGEATMTIQPETLPGGRPVLKFIVAGHSSGLVRRLYRVNDLVISVFDPAIMQPLSFSMTESTRRKTRHRTLKFDHKRNTVVFTLNQDPPLTMAVPNPVQDALSALYVLRTVNQELRPGQILTLDVHDSGQNWTIEILVQGREAIKTPAGEFSTVKVRARPTFQGKFPNKGETYIWLTDDARRIPVVLKSTIKVGSFVFTLTHAGP